jgi:type III pantothenate kinase
MISICLDFGNTRLKAAIFREKNLSEVFVLRADAEQHIREIIEKFRPDRSILSSVIEHDPAIEALLKKRDCIP